MKRYDKAAPPKHIWITGGGGAIGAALALQLATIGHKVTITGRNQETLLKTAQKHENIFAFPADITNQEQIRQVISTLGKIDLAILNAGSYAPQATAETSLESFREIMEVNYFGTLNCALPLLDQMKETGGHLAFVGSLAGYMGLPNASGYGPSKAALISFCESLQAELQNSKVKIQLISPGFVKSNLTAKNNFDMPDIIKAEEAANFILEGLESDKFEIAFPKSFSRKMKILQLLPYPLYFSLMKKLVNK